MSLLSETLDLLRQNNLRLQRRRGQNFLVDENILNKIITLSEFSKDETVLEVGTGLGFLTKKISPLVKKIITFEIDHGLARAASRVLADSKNVTLIDEDFLKFNFSKLPKGRKIKVTGNLPYNISSVIFEKIFENLKKIEAGFFMVQKEFAQRITAAPGSANYSSFSIFCQYHAAFSRLFAVSRTCFFPNPEVDSVFIKMTPRRQPPVFLVDEKVFFNIIRDTFQMRRKTLWNALTGGTRAVPGTKLQTAFEALKFDRMIRGENLSLEDFARLANLLGR